MLLLLAACGFFEPGPVDGVLMDAVPLPDQGGAVLILTDDSFTYTRETNTSTSTECRRCRQRLYRYDPGTGDAELLHTIDFPDGAIPDDGRLVLAGGRLWVLNEGAFEELGLAAVNLSSGELVGRDALEAELGLGALARLDWQEGARVELETEDGRSWELDLGSGEKAEGKLPKSAARSPWCLAEEKGSSRRKVLLQRAEGSCPRFPPEQDSEGLRRAAQPAFINAELAWEGPEQVLVSHVDSVRATPTRQLSLIHAGEGLRWTAALPEDFGSLYMSQAPVTLSGERVLVEAKRSGLAGFSAESGALQWSLKVD